MSDEQNTDAPEWPPASRPPTSVDSGTERPTPGGWTKGTLGLATIALMGWTVASIALTNVWTQGGHGEIEPPRVGMVDVQEIMETLELQFTSLVTKPNVSDADRDAAYELVKQSAPRIETLLATIQRDCACLLLTRASVVAGSAVTDYTPQIKVALGLDRVDIATLKTQVRESMSLHLPAPVKP